MTSPRAGSVKRLGAVFEQACDPIFLLDPLDRFSFVNRAWETLTGLDAEAVLGRNPEEIGPGGQGTSPFAPPPESRTGLPASGKALIHRPDGERLWRRIEFWPYRNAQGQPLGTFGLVRDAGHDLTAVGAPVQRLVGRLDAVAILTVCRSGEGAAPGAAVFAGLVQRLPHHRFGGDSFGHGR